MPVVIKKSSPPSVSSKMVQPKVGGIFEKKGEAPIQKEAEVGSPVLISGPSATVGVSFARKWSDGNFGNYSVGAWCSVEVEKNDEAIPAGYLEARKYAEAWLVDMLQGTGVKLP